MAGLGQSYCSRLKHTRNSLSEKAKSDISAIEDLMNPKQSFKTYRSALTNSSFAIPYLVVFLQVNIFVYFQKNFKFQISNFFFLLFFLHFFFLNPKKSFKKDLTFIEDGNPETIDGLINFERLTQVYEVIEKVGGFKENKYTYPIVEPVYSLCKTLPSINNDKLLYNISLYKEPRDCSIDQVK